MPRTIHSVALPFRGLIFFFTHPSIWLYTLIAILFGGLLGGLGFFFTAKFFWPAYTTFFPYVWNLFEALALGGIALLIIWIFLVPFVLSYAFDAAFRRLLRKKERSYREEGFLRTIHSGVYVFFRTSFWRIFWPVLSFVFLFLFPPASFFLSLIGMGHLTVIDAVDLSLSLKGMRGKERVHWIKEHQKKLLLAGVSGAVLIFLLGATFLGFLLFLPAIFCGAFSLLHEL